MASVLTIGVFDGVHRGHQALVAETVACARRADCQAVVVTFDPNPLEILRPAQAPTRLCALHTRVQQLESLGVDHVEVLTFDPQMAQMSADRFVDQVLIAGLNTQQIVVGSNFRFGHRAAGTAETMRAKGLDVVEFSLCSEGDEPISSTRIRATVAAGEVELAASMLGRRHTVAGLIAHGHKRGRALGYPTANLEVHPLTAVPADGVYAGLAHWSAGQAVAAISVGSNPSFHAANRTVEAYLLDRDEDLYGENMTVEFAHRLRPMIAFDNVEALIDAMADDVSKTRTLMGS